MEWVGSCADISKINNSPPCFLQVYKAWKCSSSRRGDHRQDTQSIVSVQVSADNPVTGDGAQHESEDSPEEFYLDTLFDIDGGTHNIWPITSTDPSLDAEPLKHYSLKATEDIASTQSCGSYNKYQNVPEAQHSYFPVTQDIREHESNSLLYKAEATSCGNFSASKPCCLVGLHTCGDLAATTLRLFCELPSVRAVCVVGCCYHHITENGGNIAGMRLETNRIGGGGRGRGGEGEGGYW